MTTQVTARNIVTIPNAQYHERWGRGSATQLDQLRVFLSSLEFLPTTAYLFSLNKAKEIANVLKINYPSINYLVLKGQVSDFTKAECDQSNSLSGLTIEFSYNRDLVLSLFKLVSEKVSLGAANDLEVIVTDEKASIIDANDAS